VSLNQRNILELEVLGVSFVQKLNIKDVTFMGHSFGGSTALTAAHRRPHMPLCVVAHEPAVDWMPSDSSQALFLKGQIIGNESGEEKKDNTMKQKGHPQSIHDVNMLFLYSHEWNGYVRVSLSLNCT
jgi:alpha/beta superfamily hydrolase